MSPPVLVIVSGPPGAGKTTIAKRMGAELELPVFDRDDLKDTMFEALGWSGRAWSKRVGGAAWDLLFLIGERLLDRRVSVILETNFERDSSLDRLRAMCERTSSEVVEIHCCASPAVLARRFRERWESGGRHPGHTAEFTDQETFVAALSQRDFDRPIGVSEHVIEVDTTYPERIDWTGIVSTVRSALGEAYGSQDR